MLSLVLAAAMQLGTRGGPIAVPPHVRTIAIDTRLAEDARLRVGDRVVLAGQPAAAEGGDTVVVAAIVAPNADPSEIARADYRIRLHLSELQRLVGTGDRVDRFAVRTTAAPGRQDVTDEALARINAAAFGFHAYRSSEVAVRTSRTFQVVNRFHRAIALITIVASSIFLLCILVLRVDERRRDVAALRLLGISRRSIVGSIVVEAALISLVGSGLGTAVGWAASLAINWHYRGVYRTPLAFARVTPDIVLVAVALAIVLGVGAGALAATRLVRLPPLALFGR